MKIARALLKAEAKHASEPRSLLSTEQYGDDMSFEAGLLTVRTKRGLTLLFPTGSFWWMEPAAVEKRKPAAEKP